MARVARGEVFRPDEVVTVHIYNQCVRGMHLLGIDEKGVDRSHRKDWFVQALKYCAMYFAIDLLEHSVMDNHFHTLLRSRPDVVVALDDQEVARRWLMLCPKRKYKDGSPKEPTQAELRSILNDTEKLNEIRTRLSDFSWFMRKLCQPIAQRANKEEGKHGKFWDSRYRAVRLLDEEAVLACSAYINLNPIRAVIAYTLEKSGFTSIQQRMRDLLEVAEKFGPESDIPEATEPDPSQLLDDHLASDTRASQSAQATASIAAVVVSGAGSLAGATEAVTATPPPPPLPSIAQRLTARLDEIRAEAHGDLPSKAEPSPELIAWRQEPPAPESPAGYLAPLPIDESQKPCDPCLSRCRQRCSDKGYLAMPTAKYIELLDWTARQIRPDKRGSTPEDTPPVPERLGVSQEVWLKLVTSFSELFSIVAGTPESVDSHRGSRGQRFHMKQTTRLLLSQAPPAEANVSSTAAETSLAQTT